MHLMYYIDDEGRRVYTLKVNGSKKLYKIISNYW